MKIQMLGTLKSPEDVRDWIAERKVAASPLPPSLDYRKDLLPVRDQGSLGTCAAQTAACMKEWQEKRDMGIFQYFSPMFVYNLRPNKPGSGMYPRDVMKILQDNGDCLDDTLPYGNDRTPTQTDSEQAKMYKIQNYAQVTTVDGLKQALFTQGPCFIAVPVYSFSTTMWKQENNAPLQGGHAMTCFTKDTKVSLLDGRDLDFEQLIQEFEHKNFWVYSYDIENKKIVPGLAHSPRKTSTNQNIVKVTLDNGEVIKCTPNHKFLVRSSEYVEAKDLKSGDSLMPLYKKMGGKRLEGYEQIFDVETQKWEYTHRIVKKDELKKLNEIVHHIDFNKKNNSPENLLIMDKKAHIILHAGLSEGLVAYNKSEKGNNKSREIMTNNWKNPEWVSKMKITQSKNGFKSSKKLLKEGKLGFQNWDKEELSINSSERAIRTESYKRLNTPESIEKRKESFKKHYEQDDTFRDTVIERASKNLKEYNDKIISGEISITEKQRNARINNGKNAYNNLSPEKRQLKILKTTYTRFYADKFSSFEEFLTFKQFNNHKVVSVELLTEKEDVYDLTVDTYHNFALTSGVFVHNCVGYDDAKQAFLLRNSWSSSWGDKGYCWFPYADWNLKWECWTTIDEDSGTPKKIQWWLNIWWKIKGFINRGSNKAFFILGSTAIVIIVLVVKFGT